MAVDTDALQDVPLFQGLTKRQLKRLGAKFREREFSAGTEILRQDEMSGIGFFVITDGEASVSVSGAEAARLGAGDHFGELALIAERERTATVTAETRLTCLELPAWDFREFVQSDGDVGWRLLRQVVDTLVPDQP
jgi:CRP-like cAMP-binding protein